MTSLNEISYDLAEVKGNENNYAYIERMKFHVVNYRATFIRQDQSRGNRLPVSLIQQIGCMEMKEVPSTECCGVDLGCTVWRTVERLPETVRLKWGDDFTYVGPVDGYDGYRQITKVAAAYRDYDRFSGKSPYYVYENGYLYIYGAKPKKLLVKAIFADPRALTTFKGCDGKCYSDDDDFPIPKDMIPLILKAIKADVLQIEPPDQTEKVEVDEKNA